jgi:anaerobic selenocysteine-containing dehydrogenase
MKHSYCRICDGLCGVQIDDDGALSGDPNNPKSLGHICELPFTEVPDRITTPLRREGDTHVPCSWDEALDGIARELTRLRAGNPRSMALYAGGGLARDHRGALRTAAFALGTGTPNLFSPLCLHGAPKLRAAELVMGAPLPLQADVGRSHYTILLGANQANEQWGPLQSGTVHRQALDYFRKRRKGTRLVTVSPHRTELSDAADQHVSIRAGTEVFYLLGLCHATLSNRWVDEQFLRDNVTGLDTLATWLEPWTPARCAELCGIDVGELAGVGLRYGRSAMSTVALSRAALATRHGTVTAWAWLVLHALTANLLRPGGVYETGGMVDLHTLMGAFPSDQAPQAGGHQHLLLQAPATAMAAELEGEAKALICIDGCPVSELPERERVISALQKAELVVAIDHRHSDTTRMADWVLPNPHFWERGDLTLLDTALLPSRTMQATDAVMDGPTEARATEDILRELFKRAGAPIRGAWGPHLRLAGRWLAGADMDGVVARILDLASAPDEATLRKHPHGLDDGETNRAQWRVVHDDNKLHLAPAAIGPLLSSLEDNLPTETWPLLLDTATAAEGGLGWRARSPDAAQPGITAHPDCGLDEGTLVRLETRYGAVEGRLKLSDRMHASTVWLPWGWAIPAGEVTGGPVDPESGSAQLVGEGCRLTAL